MGDKLVMPSKPLTKGELTIKKRIDAFNERAQQKRDELKASKK